jgi:hypothetical protein
MGKEWEDFLYGLGLEGRGWTHVNNAGVAYLEWRTKGTLHSKWGRVDKSKLSKLLAEPQQVPSGNFHTPNEDDRRRIIEALDNTLREYEQHGGKLEN